MSSSTTTKFPAHEGKTTRKDNWWFEPLMIAIGFTAFIVYATWRAVFEVDFYHPQQYLSPFYSPELLFDWWKWSPAILILWIPAGFRATCYYYRKAYYRAYFLTPSACAVDTHGADKYCGETKFPLIFQNAHRYFFYLAVLVLGFLWYDAIISLFPPTGGVSLSLLSIVMFANCILLSGYTFGCHAYRHLCGGSLDCFSSCDSAKRRFKVWSFVTKLNEHHMGWAWASLFSVAFTDFYVRQYACGAWDAFVLF